MEKLLILVLVATFAILVSAAPHQEDIDIETNEILGTKVTKSLKKYAEYMVDPANQVILLDRVKEEDERNKTSEIKVAPSSDIEREEDQPAIDYIIDEMGSAKDVLVGIPMIIESAEECEKLLDDEEEIRKKRQVGKWLEEAYGTLKKTGVNIKDFFEGNVKEFFEEDVKKFFKEDIGAKVKEFIEDDVKPFVVEDIPEAADTVKEFFENNVTDAAGKVSDFFKNELKPFVEGHVENIGKDVKDFFTEDVTQFFEKDVADFFTNDVSDFFVDGYDKAIDFFNLHDNDPNRSSIQDRMDDFLREIKKGVKKAAKFGICIVKKNLKNPLLKIITLAFS